MIYKQFLNILNSLQKFGCKPGLSRIKTLLSLVGNPEKKLKCIHVAGTNGKGSVCFMLANILKESGYKTGLFISPSIEDFRERIQINNEMISEKEVCCLMDFFEFYLNNKKFSNNSVTEFELITAMAFKFFCDNNCDVVVLETGMGGRLDATNVIENPLCGVITGISLEHTHVLGNSILQIAEEKCGIIKNGSPCVIADNQSSEVYRLAKKICEEKSSCLTIANSNNLVKQPCFTKTEGISFIYKNSQIVTHMLGRHQAENISVVLAVIEILKSKMNISESAIKKGLESVKIPCRLEVLNSKPLVMVDAAHNPAGARVLARFLSDCFGSKEKVLGIVGMLSDKDADGVFKETAPFLDKIFIVECESQRSMSLGKMNLCAKKYNKSVQSCSSLANAIENALSGMNENDALVIFGSFSIMGESKKIIKHYFGY